MLIVFYKIAFNFVNISLRQNLFINSFLSETKKLFSFCRLPPIGALIFSKYFDNSFLVHSSDMLVQFLYSSFQPLIRVFVHLHNFFIKIIFIAVVSNRFRCVGHKAFYGCFAFHFDSDLKCLICCICMKAFCHFICFCYLSMHILFYPYQKRYLSFAVPCCTALPFFPQQI